MEQIKWNNGMYNIYARNGEYVTLQDVKTRNFLLSIKLPHANTEESKLPQKCRNKTPSLSSNN